VQPAKTRAMETHYCVENACLNPEFTEKRQHIPVLPFFINERLAF
jgi:hypothetical protein